jgi:hypothetical protein
MGRKISDRRQRMESSEMELGDSDQDLYLSHWHVALARDVTCTGNRAPPLVSLGYLCAGAWQWKSAVLMAGWWPERSTYPAGDWPRTNSVLQGCHVVCYLVFQKDLSAAELQYRSR